MYPPLKGPLHTVLWPKIWRLLCARTLFAKSHFNGFTHLRQRPSQKFVQNTVGIKYSPVEYEVVSLWVVSPLFGTCALDLKMNVCLATSNSEGPLPPCDHDRYKPH